VTLHRVAPRLVPQCRRTPAAPGLPSSRPAFGPPLDQIIDTEHAPVKLARTIDWGFLEQKFGAVYNGPPLPNPPYLSLTRNSSILRPDSMAATNQRGRLPRPDHVSEVCGFRYFGRTAGYRRRGLSPSAPELRVWRAMLRLRIAKRISSCCFSALIRFDSTSLIFSWSDQRSSSDIASNSNFFADALTWGSQFFPEGLTAMPASQQEHHHSKNGGSNLNGRAKQAQSRVRLAATAHDKRTLPPPGA
jgi:hypothetical protein